MSLFDAPPESYIAHGCNALGVWGSGIAVPFKQKFPLAFLSYNRFCLNDAKALGKALVIYENNYNVTCLITSKAYGKEKSSKEDILKYSEQAVRSLIGYLKEFSGCSGTNNIYSNKFNSGLFEVPWEETEAVLKKVLDEYPEIDWVVCDNN